MRFGHGKGNRFPAYRKICPSPEEPLSRATGFRPPRLRCPSPEVERTLTTTAVFRGLAWSWQPSSSLPASFSSRRARRLPQAASRGTEERRSLGLGRVVGGAARSRGIEPGRFPNSRRGLFHCRPPLLLGSKNADFQCICDKGRKISKNRSACADDTPPGLRCPSPAPALGALGRHSPRLGGLGKGPLGWSCGSAGTGAGEARNQAAYPSRIFIVCPGFSFSSHCDRTWHIYEFIP